MSYHPDLSDLLASAQLFDKVSEAAQSEGLELTRLIGQGSYSLVFSEGDPETATSVIKLAWVWPHPPSTAGGLCRLERPTGEGPLAPRVLNRQLQAQRLLKRACERQFADPCETLPTLMDVGSLAGVPFARFEYIKGITLRTWGKRSGPVLPNLAVALMMLHDSFGPHGDLKPEHILVETPTSETNHHIRLLDPITEPEWLGTQGYSLGAPRGGLYIRDLEALVAIIAQLYDGNPGWDRVPEALANRGQGEDINFDALHKRLDESLALAPEALRSWASEVGHICLDIARADEDPGRAFTDSQLASLASLGATHNIPVKPTRTEEGPPIHLLALNWRRSHTFRDAHRYARALALRGVALTETADIYKRAVPGSAAGAKALALSEIDNQSLLVKGRLKAIKHSEGSQPSVLLVQHGGIPYAFHRFSGQQGHLSVRLFLTPKAPETSGELHLEMGELVHAGLKANLDAPARLKGSLALLELMVRLDEAPQSMPEMSSIIMGYDQMPAALAERLKTSKIHLEPFEQGLTTPPPALVKTDEMAKINAYAYRAIERSDGSGKDLSLARLTLLITEKGWHFEAPLIWQARTTTAPQ